MTIPRVRPLVNDGTRPGASARACICAERRSELRCGARPSRWRPTSLSARSGRVHLSGPADAADDLASCCPSSLGVLGAEDLALRLRRLGTTRVRYERARRAWRCRLCVGQGVAATYRLTTAVVGCLKASNPAMMRRPPGDRSVPPDRRVVPTVRMRHGCFICMVIDPIPRITLKLPIGRNPLIELASRAAPILRVGGSPIPCRCRRRVDIERKATAARVTGR